MANIRCSHATVASGRRQSRRRAALAGARSMVLLAFVAAAASAQDNPHGRLSQPCSDCHTTQAWAPLARPLPFRHDRTGFPLLGAHRGAACAACHASPIFSRVAAACRDCHQDPHAGELGASCQACHTPDSWTNQRRMFDVHARTLFPLLAAHARVPCEGCHGGQPAQQFSATPTDCIACHRRDFETAARPPHAGFPTDCQQCHAMPADTWNRAGGIGDIHTARFPLTGGHARVACSDCHGSKTGPIASDCVSCHRRDFEATRAPNHVTAGIEVACANCHTVGAWRPAAFDHARSRFPLDGAHRAATCESCHSAGYAGTSRDCLSCHRADYQQTSQPNHQQAGLPTSCQTCHSTAGWRPATSFDHAATRFRLDGAHRSASCEGCHKNGFAGTPTDCYSCHRTDYQATRDPDHARSGMSTTCQGCHTTAAWRPATNFDHAKVFALNGAHRTASCESCHKSGYAGTAKDCYSCHRAEYQGTKDPNHAQQGFPTACQTCHGETAWSGARFDHATTSFALNGAHRTASCESCHKSGYAGTAKDCYSCHRAEYQGTKDPNHAQQGFPTACQTCHGETTWSGARFDHATTSFALNGAHRTASCESCHKSGYAGTAKDCYSCHRAEYQGTKDPNHAQQGFPTACQTCHGEAAWTPASFQHSATRFPLTGAHLATACQACHGAGYSGTPRDCYACHAPDYQNAQPNHAAAGFPTACEGCHTTQRWDGATFDHDGRYFPIYSGSHRGEWDSCSTCHVAPGNYRVFECINCHEHNRSEVDKEHREVSGYSYDSNACYRCHPRGRGD